MEHNGVGDEVGVLASEIAAEFRRMIDGIQELFKVSAEEAATKANELGSNPDGLKRAMQCPPDQVSWTSLFVLEQSDPRWQYAVGRK
jgi:hypothetical protein